MLAQVTFEDCSDCGRTYDNTKEHKCKLEDYLEHCYNTDRAAVLTFTEAGRVLECLRRISYQEELTSTLNTELNNFAAQSAGGSMNQEVY